MAPLAASDPPLNVREKGSRIVVVFNVANVRANSVQVETRPPNEDEPSGSVHVSFNSVSPNRSFEKHLVLPYAIDGKTVKDVQSKSLTVQLVKLDETQEWGQAWLKSKGKAKRKESHEGSKTDLEGKTKTEEAPTVTSAVVEEGQKAEVKEEACEEKELIDEPRSKQVEKPEKETKLPKETKEAVEETAVADTTPEKESKLPKETKEAVEETAVADTTLTSESTGEEHKAGVKARARRGKKSKVNKEKVEEHVVEEVKEEKEVQKESPSRPEKTETAKQKAKQKAKKGESPAAPATPGPSEGIGTSEVLQDTRTRDALLEALKSPKGANDIPLPPPTDPEPHRLVSQGTSLLRSDSKKAVVLLRLAGRKGYVSAYLLLAQHAQRTQDDTLLIESLCALFTSPDRKQLPQNVLSNIVMQLTAVLRDPKNRREAEAHAADIEQIAKDWPIMNMLKLPAGESKSKIPSSPSPVKGGKSEAKAETRDFQEIKRAIATCPQDTKDSTAPKKEEDAVVAGTWRQEGGRWCLSIQAGAKEDLSTAELDISSRDLSLRAKGRLLTKLSTPENLDPSKVEASWSKKTRSLEVVAASKKVQEVPIRKKPTRHIDELD